MDQAITLAQLRRMLASGQIADALRVLDQTASRDFEVQHLRAVALHMAGRAADSVKQFEALAADLGAGSSFFQNFSLPLLSLGRFEDAVSAASKAVGLDTGNVGARINLVLALFRAERRDEAIAACRAALAQFPDHPSLLGQLGHGLIQLGDLLQAGEVLQRSLALAPAQHEAWYNLGVVHLAGGDDAAALDCFQKALALDAGHRGALSNRAAALRNLGRLDEALSNLQPLEPQKADWPVLAYNLAFTRLMTGDWQAAWPDFERRLEVLPSPHKALMQAMPRWTGEAAQDKTVLVVWEQGFGDTIQFCRFLPLLAQRVKKLVFLCQTRLHALLSGMDRFAGEGSRIELVADDQPVPAHDLHLPLLSAAHLLNLVPHQVVAPARIVVSPERADQWGARCGVDRGQLRIGLCWQGNAAAPVDRGRSLPFATLLPLLDLGPSVDCYSLQQDPPEGDARPAGLTVFDDLDSGDDGFVDTAALMSQMDLVITSDTAVAHLAGSLGRPVWLLLKQDADWRWGQSGLLTAWYPTMRLYRQARAGDWDSVIAEVKQDLLSLLALRKAAPLLPGQSFEMGLGANKAGNYAEALAIYRACLAQRPDDAMLLNLTGMALLEQGRRRKEAALSALPLVARSVALEPQRADYWSNFAILLDSAGQKADAERAFRFALATDPDHAPSLLALARRALNRGAAGDALSQVGRVLNRQPDMAAALALKASIQLADGSTGPAEQAIRRAVALEPANARNHVQLGAVLSALQRPEDAAKAWERALLLDPVHADALSNLGVFERGHGVASIGLYLLREAVKADPGHAEAWSNLGVCALECGREDEALQAFRQALHLRPDYADAHMALGMLLMGRGDFATGLQHYEWRLKIDKLKLSPLSQKIAQWRGEDPRGKHILLLAEQGFGDAFQFARYAKVLKQRGAARITVGCRAAICALMVQVDGVDAVVAEGQALPACDAQAAMMSLPLLCGDGAEQISAFPRYLQADPERVTRWAGWLAQRPGFRVGIVWQGNPDPQVDRGRSFPLVQLGALARVLGVRLISLQRGAGLEQVEAVWDQFIVETPPEDFDAGPDAFADTAAMICNLDLVVTSDTAVAHLAGALGKPVWILLKQRAEWRWLKGRVDSPWYPTARLFRVRNDDGETAPFAGVVARVAEALARLVAGDRRQLFATGSEPDPVVIEPDSQALFSTALGLHIGGKPEAAAPLYGQLLLRDPPHAEALHMIGAMALDALDFPRGLLFLQRAAAVGLDTPEFNTNLAVALRNLGQVDRAESVLRRVLARKETAEAHMTLGNLLRDRADLDEALKHYQACLALRPELAKAHRGLGNVLKDLQRPDEAIASFDRALEFAPADVETQLDRAHALLMAGDYGQGFAAYEIRWQTREMLPRLFDVARWTGETVAGKTVLIHGEQGFGDQIQFSRFIARAAERVGRVVVEVREPLPDLLRRMDFGAKVEIIAQGSVLPKFDLELPMMSLPFVLGTTLATLPAPPVIRLDADVIAMRRKALSGTGRLRVGLVWQGNPQARADKGRSPGLAALAPLFAIEGIDFVSLQHGEDRQALDRLPFGSRIKILDEGLNGFAETAHTMAALDLVISSCTASLHLAASLGMPVIGMLRYSADWRWMMQRSDSPWYPGLTLVRQKQPGDWAGVVDEIAQMLRQKVQSA